MIHETHYVMQPRYWPKTWQRVFAGIACVTYVHTYAEKYIANTHDGCRVEFDNMDQLDAYARAVDRINEANDEGPVTYTTLYGQKVIVHR